MGIGEGEGATAADVDVEVGRLRSMLDAIRPPAGPVHGRWSVGIGDVLTRHPKVPRQLHGPLHALDRFGGLTISERGLSFDGDEIEWSAINEIRSRNFVEYLVSGAVQQQLTTLPVPWFPGRRKVLDALSQALLTLLTAAAQKQLDQHQDVRIPVEISYRGAIRREKQLSPGLLATLALADPAINQCLRATAQAHGVSIHETADTQIENAAQRAQQLRARLGALSGGGSTPAGPPPGLPPHPPLAPTAAPPPPVAAPPPSVAPASDVGAPLFPSASSAIGTGTAAGYPQIHTNAGYPQIGPVTQPTSGPPPAGADPSAGRSGRTILIAAAATALVASIAAVTLFLTHDSSDSARTNGGASVHSAAPSGAAADDVSACSTPPSLKPQSVTVGGAGLTIETEIQAACESGDVLTNNAFRVTAVDGEGRDVAAGVFDLSTSPILSTAPNAGAPDKLSTVSFTFPPGTYWRVPESITGNLTITGTKDGSDATLGDRTGVSAVTAAGPSAPRSGSLDAVAQSALTDLAAADRAAIDASLLNIWQPQLSSKRPGLVADGINWDYPAILREHLDLRQRFPTARLLQSADWPVFSDPTWWVTVSGVRFGTGEDANWWCAAQGFDPDHCFAKMLSHTMDASGTTKLRN